MLGTGEGDQGDVPHCTLTPQGPGQGQEGQLWREGPEVQAWPESTVE